LWWRACGEIARFVSAEASSTERFDLRLLHRRVDVADAVLAVALDAVLAEWDAVLAEWDAVLAEWDAVLAEWDAVLECASTAELECASTAELECAWATEVECASATEVEVECAWGAEELACTSVSILARDVPFAATTTAVLVACGVEVGLAALDELAICAGAELAAGAGWEPEFSKMLFSAPPSYP
jgi:hypothetical protein